MSEVDDFAAMFSSGYGSTKDRLKTRAAKERRSNLSEKERKRVATRTAQLNFRCSPEFKDRVAAVSKQLDCSIADMFELAIDALVEAKRLKGGK